jgi:hypothetical protein
MRLTPGLFSVLMLSATVAPTWADVTLTQTTTAKIASGETISRIKGHKMRTDQTLKNGTQMTTIMDLDSGKMITLDHKKREATVLDMSVVGESLKKISDGDVKATLTPTTEKKDVAGYSCTIYTSAISVPMKLGEGMDMTMNMSGPVCLSKTAPGAEDFKQFYLAAAEKGFFFGDPRQAKAAPGQAKGMLTMYKQFAEAGVALSMDTAIKIDGAGGMMQAMMSKIAGDTIHIEVTKIETGSIADDQFTPPADYKVKTEK